MDFLQGGDSQEFLGKFIRFFFRCFIIMIFASKSTLSLNNLKILRPKVTKNLTNLPKKFCEFPPRFVLTTKV